MYFEGASYADALKPPNSSSQGYTMLGTNVVVSLLDGKLASVGRIIEQGRRSAETLLDC